MYVHVLTDMHLVVYFVISSVETDAKCASISLGCRLGFTLFRTESLSGYNTASAHLLFVKFYGVCTMHLSPSGGYDRGGGGTHCTLHSMGC